MPFSARHFIYTNCFTSVFVRFRRPIMGANKSKKFDPAVLDKYTTTPYFISKGASGDVYGPIPWQGSQLAIKQAFFTDGSVTDDVKKRIEEKKDLLNSLNHKNLMRIYWVDMTRLPKVMFLVMEFANGGSLCKALRSLDSISKLSITVVTNWGKQISDGMLYLHEKDIVHRDLKSSNILLMEPLDGRIPYLMITLKIADFDEVKEHDHTATMTTLLGTYAYMAPEVIKDQLFSKFSDVWSFGVVIWEMLSGDTPHKGLEPHEIICKTITGELGNLPLEPSFPGNYHRLLNRCWESMHTKRIPFHDISGALQRITDAKDATGILNYNGNVSQQYGPGDPRDKYNFDPYLIEATRTKSAKEKNQSIRGLAILDKELFVVNQQSPEIEVYDSMMLSFSRRWSFMGLVFPCDIVSCISNKCLYIFDYKGSLDQPSEILRVDSNGKLIKKWSSADDWGFSMSVSNESSVILTVYNKRKLNEYSPDGHLIREINLSAAPGIHSPWHAIKLDNGHFLISHGAFDDSLNRVCRVDADGKLMKSFGEKPGKSFGQMNCPVYMSVDENGFVLVADQMNHRVLLLDSNLEFRREIISEEKHDLKLLCRILLNESNGRLVAADNSSLNGGRILLFEFNN